MSRNAKKLAQEGNLSILDFSHCNIDWAQFIINNRNGIDYANTIQNTFHNLSHKYDIVIGPIADNNIINLAKRLKQLNQPISNHEINHILYHYPTTQVSFHTEASLNYITFLGYE